jgi:ribosomal protein S7
MRILEQKGKKVSYENVVEKIFEIIDSKEEGAVVLKVVQAF